MFKRNIKYYQIGFLDGVNFTTEFLKYTNYEKTLKILNNTLNNLDYYSKKYNMNKKLLKKNAEVLIRTLQHFYNV